jgi:hypothetical protein
MRQTSEQGGQLRLLAHDIHRALEKLRNLIRDHQDHVNASRLKDLLFELQRYHTPRNSILTKAEIRSYLCTEIFCLLLRNAPNPGHSKFSQLRSNIKS